MAVRQPGDCWNCEACGVRLVGARTRQGRVAPVEVEPHASGNTLLFKADDGVLTCAVTGRGVEDPIAMWLTMNGVPLRRNHFASCPHADRFRPKQEAARAS